VLGHNDKFNEFISRLVNLWENIKIKIKIEQMLLLLAGKNKLQLDEVVRTLKMS